jgi:hypothetical protein
MDDGPACLFDWACTVGKVYPAPLGLDNFDKDGVLSLSPAKFT